MDIEEKVKILQNGGFNNGIDYINGEMIFSKILKEKRKKKNLIKKNNYESMLCASGNMIDIENGQYLKSYKNEGKINYINKEYLNETDNDKQMKIKKNSINLILLMNTIIRKLIYTITNLLMKKVKVLKM